MRAVLVGPLLPFRGGLAQHTTMLHRAMAAMTDLRTISFSRQYPAWLFPGESDRDSQFAGHVESGVDYLLDSLNPLTWRAAADRIISHRPDIAVFPWWTAYWAPCFRHLTRRLRAAGIKVVFLCHNVVEHETAFWKQWLANSVLRNGSWFVAQSREGCRQLQTAFPEIDVQFHPHPIFDHYPAAEGILPRRAKWELLFYGFVRPYKGLELLLNSLASLPEFDFHLSVVGEFWGGREQIDRQIDSLGLRPRVEVVPRYVDDFDTAEFFHRADAVVLPYRSATGTGVTPIAYHYNKPVVVTAVGGLPDVVEDGVTGFIAPTSTSSAIAEALQRLSTMDSVAFTNGIARVKSRMTWSSLARTLLTHDERVDCTTGDTGSSIGLLQA